MISSLQIKKLTSLPLLYLQIKKVKSTRDYTNKNRTHNRHQVSFSYWIFSSACSSISFKKTFNYYNFQYFPLPPTIFKTFLVLENVRWKFIHILLIQLSNTTLKVKSTRSCILPSPESGKESNIFLLSDASSSFLFASGHGVLGRGNRCPGVGAGLFEKYGILRA